MHGNENADQWEEYVNNDMDRSPTSDEDLIHAKYSFDGILFSLFNKMVHFKEQLPCGRIRSQLAANCAELRMFKFLISYIVL